MRPPSPIAIRQAFSPTQANLSFITQARQQAADILYRKNPKLALIVGPCSIHNPDLALEYGEKLKRLSVEIENFFLIMRVFLEKPRTQGGWKGLLYDPHLDESHDILSGLKTGRKLFLDLNASEIPCATELLEPLAVPFYEDLITWGIVGARTSASQPHRQLASSLNFPVGFKNGIYGELDVAIAAVASAKEKHSFLYIDLEGHISITTSKGNPLSHIVLRGGKNKTNFDSESIQSALHQLEEQKITTSLLIDCSHGNSGKNPKKQTLAFQSVIEQYLNGNTSIAGLMLESNLIEGNQTIGKDLKYGVSITDPCLGWDETESLIRWADQRISLARSSIKCVQK